MLRRHDRIQHDAHMPAGGIFHSGRYVEAADGHTMVLVFYGPGAHCHVGEQVGQIPPVLRIEHLICGGKPGFLNVADVQLSDGDEPFQQVRRGLRIGLMDHAFIAFARGTGLVGIDSGDDDAFVFDLFLYRDQAMEVIHDRRLIVRGTGSDDDKEPVVGSGDDIPDLLISLCLLRRASGGKRIIRLDFFGDRKLSIECKSHDVLLLLLL